MGNRGNPTMVVVCKHALVYFIDREQVLREMALVFGVCPLPIPYQQHLVVVFDQSGWNQRVIHHEWHYFFALTVSTRISDATVSFSYLCL